MSVSQSNDVRPSVRSSLGSVGLDEGQPMDPTRGISDVVASLYSKNKEIEIWEREKKTLSPQRPVPPVKFI